MIELIGSYVPAIFAIPVAVLMTAGVLFCVCGIKYSVRILGNVPGLAIVLVLFLGIIVAYPPVVHQRIYQHPLGDSTRRGHKLFISLPHLLNAPYETATQRTGTYTDHYTLHFPLFSLEILGLVLWLWTIQTRHAMQVILCSTTGGGILSLLLLGVAPQLSMVFATVASGTTSWGILKGWHAFSPQQKTEARFSQGIILLMVSGLLVWCRWSFLWSGFPHE
jgi:hypothetical protein